MPEQMNLEKQLLEALQWLLGFLVQERVLPAIKQQTKSKEQNLGLYWFWHPLFQVQWRLQAKM